ncbi:MAG: inositol monophosphatase [Christensenellaceae bacterium]|jgi:myo-inositol-1(or 4)-monophosphatase|nr:inositol monophosphatase [Christensenellaceae bacterium]
MTKLTQFLIKIVKKSAKFANEAFIVSKKGDGDDLITDADIKIEKFLIKKIKARFGDVDIVSEELNAQKDLTPNCFVIDPIDGTINFASGLPLWGIQVCAVRGGEPVSAVLYFPRLKKIYYADGTGAFSADVCSGGLFSASALSNKQAIRVSDKPFNKSIYVVEGGDKFPALKTMTKTVSRHFRYICCASLNFAWTADGHFGGTILRKDTIWDYLPGLYLVKQAGGIIIDVSGAHIGANNDELAQVLFNKARLKPET